MQDPGTLFGPLEKKAYTLVQKGEIGASIPFFRKMVELQPYNERALNNYALSLLYQEKKGGRNEYHRDCSLAAGLLQKAIRLRESTGERDRSLALQYFHLGMALWFSERPDEAERSFAKSYAIDPGDGEALFNRMAILEEEGRMAEWKSLARIYERLQRQKSGVNGNSSQK